MLNDPEFIEKQQFLISEAEKEAKKAKATYKIDKRKDDCNYDGEKGEIFKRFYDAGMTKPSSKQVETCAKEMGYSEDRIQVHS
jgi:hypothetical protein